MELMILLQLKHFVCDFPLQGPYQYKNKGTYGHPGGLLHAGIHVFATLLVFGILGWIYIDLLWLALLEGFVHYHIDWLKMRINVVRGWKPESSEYFWWLLGFDQLLHQLTYLAMIWYLYLTVH